MRDLIVWLCVIAALPLMVRGFLLTEMVDRKLQARGHLFMAVAQAVYTVGAVLLDMRYWSYVSAACLAWYLYDWWNSGGGDGMRRAWKKVRSLASGWGVAPQAA